MNITLKQLSVFLALAKTNNMTRAAETLHLTQSACSMSLSSLETQLGGALFDRVGKKLILSERGKILFPKVANIISQIKELQEVMSGKKTGALSGHLTIGASTTIGNYIMPRIIGDFISRYPQTKITLCVDNSERIIKRLLKFDIDVAFIEGNCYSDKINLLPWRKDDLIIITSPQHSLAKQKKISLADLQKAKWILREPGSGTREKFEEAMQGKIHAFLELGHTEAIKQAVIENIGISCLSKAAVQDALKSKLLIELKTPFLKLTRDFYLLMHQKRHQTAVLTEFMKFLNVSQ